MNLYPNPLYNKVGSIFKKDVFLQSSEAVVPLQKIHSLFPDSEPQRESESRVTAQDKDKRGNAARKQTASLPHRVGGLILPHFTFLPFRQEGVGTGGGYRLALGKAGENLGHAAHGDGHAALALHHDAADVVDALHHTLAPDEAGLIVLLYIGSARVAKFWNRRPSYRGQPADRPWQRSNGHEQAFAPKGGERAIIIVLLPPS